VLKEKRVVPPPPEFAAKAHVKSTAEYERLWQWAKDDPEGFWGRPAELLHWFQPWSKVLVWDEPHAQWFGGGCILLILLAMLRSRPWQRRAAEDATHQRRQTRWRELVAARNRK
jgi:hypothetical protein